MAGRCGAAKSGGAGCVGAASSGGRGGPAGSSSSAAAAAPQMRSAEEKRAAEKHFILFTDSVGANTLTSRGPGRVDRSANCFTMRAVRSRFGVRVPLAFDWLRRPAGGFDNISRAFAQRNYRIYATGNGILLIGWWLQRVAVGWLAWTLTHSGTWLGLVSLADFLPVLFLSP